MVVKFRPKQSKNEQVKKIQAHSCLLLVFEFSLSKVLNLSPGGNAVFAAKAGEAKFYLLTFFFRFTFDLTKTGSNQSEQTKWTF
jgi:hypothetical protein